MKISIGLLLLWVAVGPAALPADPGADIEAGARLYQQGILASGEPLVGHAFADAEISGRYAACVRCHRPSGFGSYEGGYYIPPITAPYLFEGRQISRDDRFRALFMQAQTAKFRHQVRRVRDRPDYDRAALARVLREGVDTNGRQLESLMPRYDLSDADVANLEAYLATLSRDISPGVGDTFVELATVVHADIPSARREAMLGTLQSFVDWYNQRTRGDLRLAGHSVYGSSLYTRYSRLYRLHVWEIDGPPETWSAQLAEHYEAQPVFALVSGQVDGPWQEVGKFVDDRGIPALFPITELPHETGLLGGYSVYFNAGLELEADLIGNWLTDNRAGTIAATTAATTVGKTVATTAATSAGTTVRTSARTSARTRTGKIVQVFDPDRSGSRMPARRLAQRLNDDAQASVIESVEIERWRQRASANQLPAGAGSLIVWLDDVEAETLVQWKRQTGAGKLILPSGALDVLDGDFPEELADDVLFSHPQALDQAHYPERFRARAWMNTRGLDYDDQHAQYRAYYAMLMFRDSFMHLLDHYHRDYLLEVLEHQIQGSPNPGLYPDMELAPGQRFASKSGYLVAPDPEVPGRLEPVGGRIVP